MERFNVTKLQEMIESQGKSKSQFVRDVIKASPDDIRANSAYIYAVMNGKIKKPGPDYLTLFSIVLKCSRDDFFKPGSAIQ